MGRFMFLFYIFLLYFKLLGDIMIKVNIWNNKIAYLHLSHNQQLTLFYMGMNNNKIVKGGYHVRLRTVLS